METRKKVGFILGPVVFLFLYFSPILRDNPKAHSLLAIFSLIVIFWVTECIPIPITALMVPILITMFGVTPAAEAFAPFANPIIMLFLGSFILARAMVVHSLDQMLAHSILTSKIIARKGTRILFAMGLITMFLSLWISNTATTAMIYPIALGMMDAFKSREGQAKYSSAGIYFLLSIAYAASIGGIGTPIGSPPNLIAIGMLERLADYRVTFFQWMLMGLVILIPMYLVLFLYVRIRMKKSVSLEKVDISSLTLPQENSGLTRAQINVLIAFSVTVFLWILPGFVSLIWGREAPVYLWFRSHLPEAVAAIIGACLVFFLPVNRKKGRFTLPLKEAMNVDWGTLLLFGGGLSMGFQMFETGLAEAIGNFFISLGGADAGIGLISLLAITLTVFLTELTSNTASANMVIPIIIAISQSAGINPLPPVLGSAIGCSFAFMLPVATPPNAIVYGSGLIQLPQMMRFGFLLNIAGIAVIWLGVTVFLPLLGLF
ncbi:SLC13 family permease [Acidobacteriota bacterium]